MDDVDYATERAEAFNLVALRMALQRPERRLSTGYCPKCGQPIEPERLRIDSFARLCSDCAAEEEADALRRRRCGPR